MLGGGTGGTLTAIRLRRALGDGVQITVVDRDDDHVYQPGLLFVPFGLASAADLVRSRPRQLRDGIAYRGAGVDSVDLAASAVTPLHGGAGYVQRSPGLGDEFGFVPTDRHTLRSTVAPNVFAIGDAAAIPASKAGSVTHFEGQVLVRNVARFLAGQELDAGFDGHTNCFIESELRRGDADRLQLRDRAGAPATIRLRWASRCSSSHGLKGTGPTMRALGRTSGVSVKEFYQLFPQGAREARREDRRHSPQPLHLTTGRTEDVGHRQDRKDRSSSRRVPWRASTRD